MILSRHRTIAFSTGLAWVLLASSAVYADDTELFVGNASGASQAKPNVLLILDSSGSMSGLVTSQINYDPAIVYPGTCDTSRVYWATNGRPPTSCTTGRWFNLSALMCRRALDAFAVVQGGMYTDIMAQYDPGSQDRWERIASSQKSRLVECEDDRPDPSVGWAGHGDGINTSRVYARNNNSNLGRAIPARKSAGDRGPRTGSIRSSVATS